MRSVMAGPRPTGTGRSADPDVGLSKRLGASRRPAARVLAWRRTRENSLASAAGFFRAHRSVGGAARERDAVERHALDATPEELRLLGGESAGVDAHPGDLRRQAAVFDLRAAVHHRLEAVRLREFRGLVVADAQLDPAPLRHERAA